MSADYTAPEGGEDTYLGTYVPSEELEDTAGATWAELVIGRTQEVGECKFCGALVALDAAYCGECDTEVIA
jgi:hypothetical protein